MGGSLLQLVAKSVEDIFLTNDPEMTLFKIVYRRHTNFSKEEKKLQFSSKMDFGKKGVCKLRSYGDFIGQLYLVIKLPTVDIQYNKLTILHVQNIFKTNNMVWNTSDPDETEITNSHLDEILVVINNRALELQLSKDIITHSTNDNILDVIDEVYQDGSVSDEDFFETLLDKIIKFDPKYYLDYEFLKAYKLDETDTDESLTNLKQLTGLLFNTFKSKIIPDDNTSFHDENINLLNTVYRHKFPISTVNTGISSSSHFKNTIKEIYNGIDNQYEEYDSYKIVEQYLDLKQTTINNTFDVFEIKDKIFNHILYDVGKNIQLLIKIYNNLGSQYLFTFYKRYLYSSTSDNTSSSEEFINLSTTNISRFNDNFTNDFSIDPLESEPTDLTHFYSNYVQSFIPQYHITNKNYFRVSKYENYFGNTSLWKKMDLLTLIPSTDAVMAAKLSNFYILDLIPVTLISDINSAFIFIMESTLEKTGVGALNLIGLSAKVEQIITPITSSLRTEIIPTEIITAKEVELLYVLSGIYRKNFDNDIFVIGFFKYFKYFTYKATLYNVMEYIRQIYTARTIIMMPEYDIEVEKLTLSTNLSWVSLDDIEIGDGTSKRNTNLTLNASDASVFEQSGTGNYFYIYSAYDATQYVIWYNVDSGNTAPVISGATLIEVNILSSDNANTIISTTSTALSSEGDFSISYSNNILHIKNSIIGTCLPVITSNMPNRLTLSEITTGSGTNTSGSARSITITTQDKASYVTTNIANYFLLFSADNADKYYVWLKTNGSVANPNIDGFTEMSVDISSSTSATDVATAITTVINSNANFTATNIGEVITVTNVNNGLSGPATIGDSSTKKYKAILNIVEMFFMTDDDKSADIETILPEYTKYKSNSLSLFQVNNSQVQFLNPIESVSDEAIVIDAPSSIWYNIYTKLINNYNDFYNKSILLNSYIDTYLGKNITEFKAYIDKNSTADIFNSITIGDGEDYEVNYYLATPTQTQKIVDSTTGYLSVQLHAYNSLHTLHNNNKNALSISHTTLPIQDSLFESFSNMINFFETTIYQSFDSVTLSNSITNEGYEHDPEVIDFQNTTDNLYTNGTRGVMDKFNALQTIKDIFFDVSNTTGSLTPLELDINTSVLYNSKIKPLDSSQRIELKAEYDALFSSLTSKTFHDDINNIVNNFNGFGKESDLYDYLLSIVKKASILCPIINLEGSARLETKNAIVAYYNSKVDMINLLLNTINDVDGDSLSMYEYIKNIRAGISTPKFAWIEHLGQYIINSSYIDLGGEIIDKQTGEWLHINSELTLPSGKKKGYNRSIGNISQLTAYENTKKKEFTLYIPLQHWFCKKISSMLPIVAMNHTYVNLHIDLKEFGECAYWEELTYFKKRPQLSSVYVLADYYYVEPTERKHLVTNKHEMLIETVQCKNNVYSNSYSLSDQMGEIKLNFYGSCKEYFWVAQKNTYEDGTYLSPQVSYLFGADELITSTTIVKRKSLHYYGENEDGTGNPLKQIKFNFNGVEREKFKDSMVYDTIYPQKCHTNTPSDGIMVYPLCLYPELLQPSGTANNSQIDDVEFVYTVTDNMYNEMISKKTVLRFAFYALSYNILRIMSGMAGLAYLEN